MISDLVFEQIEGNFWFAAYGPFRVIMMKDTGYINATKLCSSGGKDYYNWSRLKGSHDLIQALENKLALENTRDPSDSTLQNGKPHIWGLPSSPCKSVQTHNDTEVERVKSGTYCHPLLIPHIACWVSPEFATLDAHRAQQQVEQKDQQVQQKEHQVQQKDQQLQQKEHRHQVWSSTHGFTMLRLNNPEAKLPYYAVRCKRGDMSGAIKKVRAKHPHSIMIYQNSYVANPINLYNRLKNCGFLRYSRHYCGSYVREGELITKLGELCTIVK